MTDSLREQLLKLGFKKPEPVVKPQPAGGNKRAPHAPAPAHDKKPGAARPAQPQRPSTARPQAQGQRVDARPPKPPRSQEEIDLARAYALRDRQEREEREAAKREAETKARERRERRQQLQALVQGKTINDPEADLMRHFPHRDKIKRIHVNAAQLSALNAGELGVVQIEGRYLLVDREVALAVRAVFEDALVLLPEPGATEDDDAAHAAAFTGD